MVMDSIFLFNLVNIIQHYFTIYVSSFDMLSAKHAERATYFKQTYGLERNRGASYNYLILKLEDLYLQRPARIADIGCGPEALVANHFRQSSARSKVYYFQL
jgi:hypothetical protein